MPTNSDWLPLGGTSRNFRNVKTGEIISRRQYDKRFGTLAKQGYRSYEQKARVYQPEVSHLRPARGRKTALAKKTHKTIPDLSRIRPNYQTGSIARRYYVTLLTTDPEEAARYVDLMIDSAIKNPLINSLGYGATYINSQGQRAEFTGGNFLVYKTEFENRRNAPNREYVRDDFILTYMERAYGPIVQAFVDVRFRDTPKFRAKREERYRALERTRNAERKRASRQRAKDAASKAKKKGAKNAVHKNRRH